MKTTKKHFQLFCDEAKKWQRILGLQDVELAFTHQYIDDETFANCYFSAEGRSVLLEFNETWPDTRYPLNNRNVRLSACHEMFHVLTGPLVSRAKTRYIMEHEITECDHAIVQTLVNVLFDKY